MRRRASMGGFVALVVAALLMTGCDKAAEADANDQAAATAGRACQVIEYGLVERDIGVRFDTAGGAKRDETYSCVLGVTGAVYPDLTLSLSTTAADELIFVATVRPSGAQELPGLGVSGYQVVLPPVTASDGTASGQALELGWLSAGHKLVFLRYTFTSAATSADLEAMAVKLLTLSRHVEQAITTLP